MQNIVNPLGSMNAPRSYNQAVAMPELADITGLLKAWGQGDQRALEQLMPLVYAQLRAQARRYLRNERSGITLQSTALVHELYLRLTRTADVDCHDRAHFLALSARIMRRVLVDAARARNATKRGGMSPHAEHSSAVDLDQIPAAQSDTALLLCALDDALESLAQTDPRRAKVIELRFFGGLSVEETADLLQVSPPDSDARLAARPGVAGARVVHGWRDAGVKRQQSNPRRVCAMEGGA